MIDACNFYGKCSVYDDHGGIALAQDEGIQIAKALGDNMACILQNHGYETRRNFERHYLETWLT